jgi:hypothetical protein
MWPLSKNVWFYQSLVASVVFGAKLDKKNHNLIPATAIRKGLELLDVRTDPRIRLNWWLKKKCDFGSTWSWIEQTALMSRVQCEVALRSVENNINYIFFNWISKSFNSIMR